MNATYHLEAREVTKVYGKGETAVTAVDQASLQVKPGEVCLILGPSGSGKTTFLSLLGCLLKPTSGKIAILGQEVAALNERALPEIRRQHLGFIFQSFNLLEALTAAENVEIVLNLNHRRGRQAKQRAVELLQALGMRHRASYLPGKLSGGEKQRVAIARALANDPAILLADEPTGSLDSKTGHEVITLLCRLAQSGGKSVIIASHDLRIRDVATHIYHLEDGRLRKA